MDWENYIADGMLHATEADFESCEHGAIKPTYFIHNGDESYVLQTVQDGEEGRLYTTKHIFDRLEDSGVPTPSMEFDGSAQAAPFYVVEHLDGENPQDSYASMDEAAQLRIAEQAGYYLGIAHDELAVDGNGELDAAPDRLDVKDEASWRSFFTDRMTGKVDYLDDLEDDDSIVEDAYELIDDAQHLAPEEPEPGILHLDYRPGNLLVDDGDITAVLDWDNAIAGDQLYDYVKSESSFADRFDGTKAELVRDRFRQGYEAAGQSVEQDETYQFYRFCAALSKTKALRYVSRQYDKEHHELEEQFRAMLQDRQQDVRAIIDGKTGQARHASPQD